MIHSFKLGASYWKDVFPGDLVVCPGAIGIRVSDFETRSSRPRYFRFVSKPLLVISVLDHEQLHLVDVGMTLFTVLSRHGVLCVIMSNT